MLGACTALSPASREIFDEESGSTETVVAQALVFARERSDMAAHARDYATLVAVEIDRSGEYNEYLLVYRWSTLDRRMSPPPEQTAGDLRILADGRVIELTPLQRLPVSLRPRDALHVPDHADLVAHAYRVDTPTLQFIALSRDIALHTPQDTLDTPFLLWKDGRGALAQFLQRAVAP